MIGYFPTSMAGMFLSWITRIRGGIGGLKRRRNYERTVTYYWFPVSNVHDGNQVLDRAVSGWVWEFKRRNDIERILEYYWFPLYPISMTGIFMSWISPFGDGVRRSKRRRNIERTMR